MTSHVGIHDNELANKAAKASLKVWKINTLLPFIEFRHIKICKEAVVKFLVTANRKQIACSAAHFKVLDVVLFGKVSQGNGALSLKDWGTLSSPRVISGLEKIHQSISPPRNA